MDYESFTLTVSARVCELELAAPYLNEDGAILLDMLRLLDQLARYATDANELQVIWKSAEGEDKFSPILCREGLSILAALDTVAETEMQSAIAINI